AAWEKYQQAALYLGRELVHDLLDLQEAEQSAHALERHDKLITDVLVLQEGLELGFDVAQVFGQQRGQQVGLLEVALGVTLRGQPIRERIGQVEQCPVVTSRPCGDLELVDFGSQAQLFGLVVDAENH